MRELRSIKKRLNGDAGSPIISNWPFFSSFFWLYILLFLSDSVGHRV